MRIASFRMKHGNSKNPTHIQHMVESRARKQTKKKCGANQNSEQTFFLHIFQVKICNVIKSVTKIRMSTHEYVHLNDVSMEASSSNMKP